MKFSTEELIESTVVFLLVKMAEVANTDESCIAFDNFSVRYTRLMGRLKPTVLKINGETRTVAF